MSDSIGSVGFRAIEHARRLEQKYVTSGLAQPSVQEELSDAAVLRESLVREDGAGTPPGPEPTMRLSKTLGFDIGSARIHVGSAAAAAAQHLKADAFTIGRDVFFAPGKYDPPSRAGLGLLAHEMTHVVQQSRGESPSMPVARSPAGSDQESGGGADPSTTMHQDEQAGSPASAFAIPHGSPPADGSPAPSMTATEGSGAAAKEGDATPPSKADPRAVADKVYDLMREEVMLGRLRGVGGRKG